jgi:aspartyl-tRNA(Asn)/glutamyl-tRNA(Gln) amidotransferase subunit A
MLEPYIPPFSADVVQALKAGGAILVGQTNMDEFGMGSATTNSAMGPSINPLPHLHPPASSSPPNLTPGGSSGGSASSVAWRSSFASIGSDTGGSVRLPAAHTNTTGFKPTYGSISRFGLIPYASSLDTIGLIAPTPSDTKLLFDVLRGQSPNDPTSIESSLPPSSPAPLDWSTISVCLPSAYSVEEMPPSVLHIWNETAECLASLGSRYELRLLVYLTRFCNGLIICCGSI